MPLRTPTRKLMATPTPLGGVGGGGFFMQGTPERDGLGDKGGNIGVEHSFSDSLCF